MTADNDNSLIKQKPRGGSSNPGSQWLAIISKISVHNEEGFPRIHHVMSRKLHRFESREDAPEQPPPQSPQTIRAAIPPRNRKISTGPGLQTIEDDDDDDEKKAATSHAETESES